MYSQSICVIEKDISRQGCYAVWNFRIFNSNLKILIHVASLVIITFYLNVKSNLKPLTITSSFTYLIQFFGDDFNVLAIHCVCIIFQNQGLQLNISVDISVNLLTQMTDGLRNGCHFFHFVNCKMSSRCRFSTWKKWVVQKAYEWLSSSD